MAVRLAVLWTNGAGRAESITSQGGFSHRIELGNTGALPPQAKTAGTATAMALTLGKEPVRTDRLTNPKKFTVKPLTD